MEQNKDVEIIDNNTELISVRDAEVSFPDFGYYRDKCLLMAEEIRTIEVTEENVKIVKKDLADTRKFIKAIDDRRKEVKNEVLKPYLVIEKQVKELISIVDEADKEVRDQVKYLENVERDAKRTTIRDLWNKRVSHYDIDKYIDDAFERWLVPAYLNKSTTMKSVESAMVDWMEMVQKEITAILGMPDAADIMVDYAATLDFAEAVNRHKARDDYKHKFDDKDPEEDEDDTAMFKVEGLANIELVERLMKDYGIKYIKY